MKNKLQIFTITFGLLTAPLYGDSLLQPVTFPKTFNDVPFADKWAVIAEGYGAFDRQYDENGRCIVGCPYAGMTIEQDKQNTEEATQYFAGLVNSVSNDNTDTEPENQNVVTPNGQTQENNASFVTMEISRGSLPLRSPVNISDVLITGDFGWRELKGRKYLHSGIDIGVDIGTSIYAAGDGVVQRVKTGCVDGAQNCGGGTGNYVLVKHAHGLYSEYMHLSSVKVSNGDKVRAGQLIGLSGNTGYSFGAHLHYDIYLSKNGTPAYIDVLCPCAANKQTKNYSESLTNINTSYTCKHCAMNRQYRFKDGVKKTQWRIASGHCMTTPSDKLPDEI